MKHFPLHFGFLTLALGACQASSGSHDSLVQITAVRCESGATSQRPYPELHYMKVGAQCINETPDPTKDSKISEQLSVNCRSFDVADDSGAIQTHTSKTDPGTGNCTFSLDGDQSSRVIMRNDSGDYIYQDYANETPTGAPVAMSCHTTAYKQTYPQDTCSDSLLAVPADGASEAALLGVQGVCVTKDSCREVSGLSDTQLTSEQDDCKTNSGTWRVGTCSMATISYTFGCLKTPARSEAPTSTAVVWSVTAPNPATCSGG